MEELIVGLDLVLPPPPLVRFEVEGDGEKVELPAATRQEMHSMAYQRLPIAFMEYTHGI